MKYDFFVYAVDNGAGNGADNVGDDNGADNVGDDNGADNVGDDNGADNVGDDNGADNAEKARDCVARSFALLGIEPISGVDYGEQHPNGEFVHSLVVWESVKHLKAIARAVKVGESVKNANSTTLYFSKRDTTLEKSKGWELIKNAKTVDGAIVYEYALLQNGNVIIPTIPAEHVGTIVPPMVGGKRIFTMLSDLADIAPAKKTRKTSSSSSSTGWTAANA